MRRARAGEISMPAVLVRKAGRTLSEQQENNVKARPDDSRRKKGSLARTLRGVIPLQTCCGGSI